MKNILRIGAFILSAVCGACASQSKAVTVEVMRRGAGKELGTVVATAAVTEDRGTGEITGDTKKYGFIENIPVSRVTTGKKPPKQAKEDYSIPTNAAEIAYTNAVYEIIQQAKKMGATGVTNVISDVKRNYDPDTKIEKVQVRVAADAVMLPQ
jgi:hypothetical protein